MRCNAACLLLGLLACGGGGTTTTQPVAPQGDHRAHGQDHFHHSFADAERWAEVFDDPARDEWQRPDEVVASLRLASDARVADLGAGTGYFAVRLARAVPVGKVYAIDIEPDMVGYMEQRATDEGLSNMVPVLGAADDPRIPEPVDLVLIVDTYHHLADRVPYFERLAGSLRPGGRVAIVDFTAESPIGPPVEHRIPIEGVLAELAEAGFHEVARHDFLPNQYFVEVAR